MRITYQMYNGNPNIVEADMSDTKNLVIHVTRGDAISVKFAGENKKLQRGCALFNTENLKDGIHRIILFSEDGAHELIPIKAVAGTVKLLISDELIATLYKNAITQQMKIDELEKHITKITAAVFGSKIF